MRNWKGHVTALALVMFQTNAWSATALGEINIQMSGNIVDFTCVAEGSDSDKTVTLGTWPTKQLSTTGSRTQPMPFTLKLTGCPPGAASITFSGKADGSNNGLLALNDASTAAVSRWRSGMRIKRVWLSSRPASRSRLMQQEMRHCRFMPIILPLQITLSPDGLMRMPPL
jgi:type 1 fimbria pilin